MKFWTDSCVVLDWIQRQNKLESFVAHRVNEITLHSDPLDWKYVPTKQNPSDHGTRGLRRVEIPAKWIEGPSFLNELAENWPKRPQTTCTAIVIDQKSVLFDTERFSTWINLLKVVANVFRFVRRLRSRTSPSTLISEDFRKTNRALIKQSQSLSFASTFHQLRRNLDPTSRDKFIPFRPFIDQDSLLRSHGRLVYAPLAQAIGTPVLLDSKEPITKLYLKHAHEICCHAGPEFVEAFVEQRLKVLGIRDALHSVNYRCFICRCFRAENVQPEMAPLPQLRFPSPKSPFPFEKTGVDLFGPFFIVNGRKTEKQYGIIFNCLVTRACYLESCSSMTTDSFLNVFRRFIARRGHPRLLRSGNGKKFVGARRELQACLNDGIAAV